MEATTPVKLPTKQCPPVQELEFKQTKGRISTAAPQILAYLLQSLRPILHIACPNSMLSYSKGSRPVQELEFKQTKGRISTAAPQILAYLLQSLRPILHIACPNSMLSYSKVSRGLFVPSRVNGIFTDTSISLSSRLRQRPDHFTIRAGLHLPDKEFRYLRNVIVSAAVYRGFNSMLPLACDISS